MLFGIQLNAENWERETYESFNQQLAVSNYFTSNSHSLCFID